MIWPAADIRNVSRIGEHALHQILLDRGAGRLDWSQEYESVPIADQHGFNRSNAGVTGLYDEPMPLLSVITPAFNGSRFVDHYANQLEQAVHELGEHAIAELFEVVVVDDRSTDDTAERIERLSQTRGFIRLERNPKDTHSASAVRLFGATKSTGRYVWFCDIDDDFDLPGILRLAREAQAADVDLAVFNAAKVQAHSGRIIESILDARQDACGPATDTRERVLRELITGHMWNKLYRRELLEHLEAPPVSVHGDLWLNLQISGRVKSRLDRMTTMYRYVQWPDSLLQRKSAERFRSGRILLEVTQSLAQTTPELAEAVGVFRINTVLVPLANLGHASRFKDAEREALWLKSELSQAVDHAVLRQLSRQRRIQLFVLRRFWHGYGVAYRIFRKVKWGNSS